ncbi:MAG: phosphatidate cytidylyltransferase, partial [Lachnospiraceae bacterium]|nr:phosphatidate cytidylyltransferase [Lachnospiraceae bacterium]
YTYLVINRYTEITLSLPFAAVLGAVGALVSMVGDLAASAVKRDHGIKDYGKLIPGHGGIMDRFDSVIVAAPIVSIGIYLILSMTGIKAGF